MMTLLSVTSRLVQFLQLPVVNESSRWNMNVRYLVYSSFLPVASIRSLNAS